jgi:hypothetical protein
MNLPSVLFIPDRFMDHRLWSDIPDRLRGHAEIVHYDQHEQVPWTTGPNAEFVDAARRLASDGSFHIVAAAGQAARFAFALAEAGLAKGLVFFYPSLDCVPDDVDIDFSGLNEALIPYEPIVDAVHEPDPGRQREILLAVLRETGRDLEPAELQRAIGMFSDHAEEIFAEIATAAAAADGPAPPDPPWLQHPWINRLGELAVPVMAVVPASARITREVMAKRAKNVEIIVTAGTGLEQADDRARSARALLRMLDRVN